MGGELDEETLSSSSVSNRLKRIHAHVFIRPKKHGHGVRFYIGLDSTFGGLEAIITGLCDEYPNVLKRHRELFVAGLVAVIYILSLPTTTYVRN